MINVSLWLHHGFLWHRGRLGFSSSWQWVAQIYLSAHTLDHQWGPVTTTNGGVKTTHWMCCQLRYGIMFRTYQENELRKANICFLIPCQSSFCMQQSLPVSVHCFLRWPGPIWPLYHYLRDTGYETDFRLTHWLTTDLRHIWNLACQELFRMRHLPMPFMAL